ncbi:MAG: hypothetical protein A3F18_05025 [Legionellales bacterium RIFCSPHIGHO2_12_FULL_37_14]|nr:MAG: hypothetical protein A3F18_05025 [Legionellales bacterium RIFCSPHIGHO2_12_FULL_37_14]
MTSKNLSSEEAFIWIWLREQAIPVVAGKLIKQDKRYFFIYGKSYLERKDAISLSPFELPLTAELFEPTGMKIMPACIRDALPDSWGRRLLEYQYPHLNLQELDYALLSGSNRIGSLDFQQSATAFISRDLGNISLNDINNFAGVFETDQNFSKKLAPIFLHGTSVGGARPKCLINIHGVDYIAKFSLSTDYYPLLRTEYLAMRLAKLVGIDVAEVEFKTFKGRDILLIKRFDRYYKDNNYYKRLILSGLSLLELDEMEARYASYIDLADIIRAHFYNPKAQLQELYQRLAFNILIGNTDDHARNHAAFWDGKHFSLTKAYDICPQMRVGYEANQAMMIEGSAGQRSTFNNILSVCDRFLLTRDEARQIINNQIQTLGDNWHDLCTEIGLKPYEQDRLLGTVIKSKFALLDWQSPTKK